MKENATKRRQQHSIHSSPHKAQNRRVFMKRLLAAGAAVNLPLLSRAGNTPRRKPASKQGNDCPDTSGSKGSRRLQAYKIRVKAASQELHQKPPEHPNNGDECLLANRIGSYTKGLPHNAQGEVDQSAYDTYLNALTTGKPADFEQIPLGCSNGYKLVNPQAGLAFDLEGADSHCTYMPPAPAFGSDEMNAELIELYWMALTRDVPFSEYDTNPLTQQAAADLTKLGDAFTGPKINGQVTTATLFRDNLPGALVGPYQAQSQFRFLPIMWGANALDQRMATVLPGQDFMTTPEAWLSVQNGCIPTVSPQIDPTLRYVRNGRDDAWWVHADSGNEAAMFAALILLYPLGTDVEGGMITAPLNPGNPYLHSANQTGFGTFGLPHGLTLVTEATTRAAKAVWYQKWFVHRRVRPEAYAGAVDRAIRFGANYPVNAHQLLQSDAPNLIFQKYGSYLLPQVFPEGSPVHPSYGSGHATITAACITMCKAFFDESFVIPNPVMPDADGTGLVPYTGADAGQMTVGGELNKLVSNISQSRNIAGVHWRSDAVQSYSLGEAVALSILRDQQLTYNEDFQGFTFTKFDGTQITV
jgi:membrane-associated phospholipid phosphatase